ncbi:hypothetical protein B4114_0597 [Geobacillus stearothermophilus]|uniref:Uncharacterized protein n=1 Tax=Geobacillus stearothermophilus TaxID=1422 RepID=A0A150N361_GEOSE|nr:hypothetical protein B4114_0597 [Geobacillus stearothermophilus]
MRIKIAITPMKTIAPFNFYYIVYFSFYKLIFYEILTFFYIGVRFV